MVAQTQGTKFQMTAELVASKLPGMPNPKYKTFYKTHSLTFLLYILLNILMQTLWRQSSIARLKFWGSEGVKRDIKTAVKYYEKSVQEMPENAVALYDYGIVLLRVR